MSPLRILPPAACCFAPTSVVHTAFSMQSSLLRYEPTGSDSSCNQAGLLLLLLLLCNRSYSSSDNSSLAPA